MEVRQDYGAILTELGERFASAVVETAEAIAGMPLRLLSLTRHDVGRRAEPRIHVLPGLSRVYRVVRHKLDHVFRMG